MKANIGWTSRDPTVNAAGFARPDQPRVWAGARTCAGRGHRDRGQGVAAGRADGSQLGEHRQGQQAVDERSEGSHARANGAVNLRAENARLTRRRTVVGTGPSLPGAAQRMSRCRKSRNPDGCPRGPASLDGGLPEPAPPAAPSAAQSRRA